jgi:hypothetical protein
MAKKEPRVDHDNENSTTPERVCPKHDKPKILAIDLDEADLQVISGGGYNIASGTFGSPYVVTRSADFSPVLARAVLPNYTEQEIVIADLLSGEPGPTPDTEKHSPEEEPDWWAKCSNGVIDPRPRVMASLRDRFDRVYQAGGVFIVFADARNRQKLVLASVKNGRYGSEFQIHRELQEDNWSFLPVLSDLQVREDRGEEISPIQENNILVQILRDNLEGASFHCTLMPQERTKQRWLPLAHSKYGEAVAGAIAPSEKDKSGWVLVFPQIHLKGRFLKALLDDVLPRLAPALFPHAKEHQWIHRPEYEIPSVLEKQAKLAEIEERAQRERAAVSEDIQLDREAGSYMYDLVRETGAPLVKAVQKALAVLGFSSVVDVDDEMRKAGKASSLREDLRIHDKSPTLVVDIKGVAGHPSDPEALQATKNALIYIHEQGRADVHGLTIINHQRHLPPLDRDNAMPFRKEILDNAEQTNLGLLTGWDLFRLVRGFLRNGWVPDQVKPLFYKTGRILPIPTHYEAVGSVKQVWKPAFSVLIEHAGIQVGDRIAVEFSVDFPEFEVTSLQLGNSNVAEAKVGNEIGIARPENLDLDRLRPGQRVYRLAPSTNPILVSGAPE